MTKVIVRFHPDAEAEYLEALRWYRERSPASAVRFEAEFSRSIERIEQAPERWPRYLEDSRRFLLHQFPFEIVYQQSSASLVLILRSQSTVTSGPLRRPLSHPPRSLPQIWSSIVSRTTAKRSLRSNTSRIRTAYTRTNGCSIKRIRSHKFVESRYDAVG